MELKKEMFLNEDDELNTKAVVDMIVQHPNEWEKIMKFIGDLMTDELEFKYEKKWLKQKYHHDMRELYEKYWYDLDDKED